MDEDKGDTMILIAEPVSRKTLMLIAIKLRELSGYSDGLCFPILKFLEHKMPLLFSGFDYKILPKSYFSPNTHAETSIEEQTIRIREDVYLGAYNGLGRDRMTIAHEVAHYILLGVKGLKLYRSFEGAKIENF